jgi:hypothetical protein
VSFQLENDLFAGTDAQYTNGVKLTWVSPNISDFNDPLLPAWIRCSNEAVRHLVAWFLPNNASVRNMVVTLGQAMYTPADRDRTTLDPRDRPYAGWTYLGLGYNVRFDGIGRAPVLDTVEIDLGIVGPNAYAKQTQDLVHGIRGLPRFQGWSNPIARRAGSPGRLGAQAPPAVAPARVMARRAGDPPLRRVRRERRVVSQRRHRIPRRLAAAR